MREIFVFGSNLGGRHGKGAALYAVQHHGAIYGQCAGLQGNSYAIPTKDGRLRTLPLREIQSHVKQFIRYAFMCELKKVDYMFKVTPIGCGLAGYTPKDIAPMFQGATALSNVVLPDEFLELLSNTGKTRKELRENRLKLVDKYLANGKTKSWIAEKLGISPAALTLFLQKR